MYVINGESWSEDRVYACNKLVAEWLMYKKELPLFASNTKEGKYYFFRTEALRKAISEMPVVLRIAKNL